MKYIYSVLAKIFVVLLLSNTGSAASAAENTAPNPVTEAGSGFFSFLKVKGKKDKKSRRAVKASEPTVEISVAHEDTEVYHTGEDFDEELLLTDSGFLLEDIETRDAESSALSGLNVYDDASPLYTNLPAEVLDSLVSRWNERNVFANYDNYFRDFIDLDSTASLAGELPDSVYSIRLKNLVSPIYLGYNDIVKRYVIAYTQTRRGTMARILGLSQVYFPMIEEELAAAGLPLELRMLPVIESALNPTAVSRMGATGLWQFMSATGKAYGLEVTSYIDQRRDPLASTRAACRFLKDLYDIYNDWTLALAAYNCGPGNVNKAIKRAGGNARTFWDIYDYLPRETRGYVPAFIGATYAFAYHKQHGIEPVFEDFPIARDTVHVDKLMHFEQVASTMGLNIETLRALNPQYKLDIVPSVENKTYPLTLPQYEIARYIEHEAEIHSKDTVYLAQFMKQGTVTNAKKIDISSTEYRIKSGDTLGAVARRCGVTVNQIMKWNNISNPHKLKIGQRIEIHK